MIFRELCCATGRHYAQEDGHWQKMMMAQKREQMRKAQIGRPPEVEHVLGTQLQNTERLRKHMLKQRPVDTEHHKLLKKQMREHMEKQKVGMCNRLSCDWSTLNY